MTVPAGRRYLPGTLVLETTWRGPGGWMVVRDDMCIGRWYHQRRRPGTTAAPIDHEAEHILLRTVKCIIGSVELGAWTASRCSTTAAPACREYSGQWLRGGDADGGEGDVQLRLVTDLRVGFEGRGAHARTTLREGDRPPPPSAGPSFPVVGLGVLGRAAPPANTEEAFERMERTAEFWRGWINQGVFPEHPWQSHPQRSALTLKGLTYGPTGALLAAATTPLPETPGGERNYDYRYTWIRDATFMLWGLLHPGVRARGQRLLLLRGRRLQRRGRPAPDQGTGVGGEAELPEEEIDHLRAATTPSRCGSARSPPPPSASTTFSGADPVYLHTKSRDYLPERVWPILKRAMEAAIANWNQPDQGIWEVRGRPGTSPSSKLMCWVACDRGAAGQAARRPRPGRRLAQGGRRDPRRHLRARGRRAGRVRPALRDHRP